MSRRPHDLARFLRPQTVAVVGASERQSRSNNAVGSMLDQGMRVFLVNPNRPKAYGTATYASLADIPEPVDAVLSLVGAEAAVGVVQESAAVSAGGVVVIAGGFAESGPAGTALQDQLRGAAGTMPVLGPNCNGFVRPSIGARLSGTPRWPFPGGSIGVVTHSGAMLGPMGIAAGERGLGISSQISTGNEMSVDMADCIEFLVDDDETRCIALLVETVREPERFFNAVRRAVAKNKPVVAVKLGRSARGSEIASSHTGALAGEAWVYDAAFRQHGVAVASDLEDLLDRLMLCAQLPPETWTPMAGVAIASLSGGFGALASDVFADEGVALPALSDLSQAINALIPERSTINPLDMTGFVMGRSDVVKGVVEVLAEADEVDAVLLHWPLIEEGAEGGEAFVAAAVAAAGSSSKPVVLWSLDDGRIGAWARELSMSGVAVTRGVRGTARAVRTMGDFVTFRSQRRDAAARAPVSRVARPAASSLASSAGTMLAFEDSMALLTGAGIPVAPFAMIADGAEVPRSFDFCAPYVVKLADVPHRTDIGAVRLGVTSPDLADAVSAMRALARAHGVSPAVVVQRQVPVDGEAFVGVQTSSDLGPLVLFGVGGVFIEVLGRVAGGLAPLDVDDARLMLDSLADTGVFAGARGRRPWDYEQLGVLLISLGRLAAGAGEWLESLDVNPLVLTADGFVAVDALCLLR
jgi:acyl-CoA synthetase (NDP forming)